MLAPGGGLAQAQPVAGLATSRSAAPLMTTAGAGRGVALLTSMTAADPAITMVTTLVTTLAVDGGLALVQPTPVVAASQLAVLLISRTVGRSRRGDGS
mmetsp:Transcript_88973/g.203501  ORF Transcript_88973/g.203501 Transcript_88973/m.203501 type:complete len:98 (-) Transcript_88973:412-705(-)